MDGFTAALALCSQFDLPCVFLSAFDSGASLQQARLAAPAGYLAKPFSDDALRLAIEAALNN
ncbi:MAG: response regulator [Rhodoferax sp.]